MDAFMLNVTNRLVSEAFNFLLLIVPIKLWIVEWYGEIFMFLQYKYDNYKKHINNNRFYNINIILNEFRSSINIVLSHFVFNNIIYSFLFCSLYLNIFLNIINKNIFLNCIILNNIILTNVILTNVKCSCSRKIFLVDLGNLGINRAKVEVTLPSAPNPMDSWLLFCQHFAQ